ncbi:uncharacterized protein NEMAJ01_2129 [Nematocida major]|uniref:uncharacterized protein n=1 Tax=Nematocida major TaxID=1912982 RepID=UPI002007F00B|nr:uncharacterized protein NEMAJ01_2129 [Nematocida major]KAH9387233.1 hypothetical protein NEMAJ01_2129 [Nematocida major]
MKILRSSAKSIFWSFQAVFFSVVLYTVWELCKKDSSQNRMYQCGSNVQRSHNVHFILRAAQSDDHSEEFLSETSDSYSESYDHTSGSAYFEHIDLHNAITH